MRTPVCLKEWKVSGGCRIIRLLSGRSNVFLLTNGKANILVDTSVRRLRKKLEKRLYRLGVTRIDVLALTHSHFDHSGNARRIREKYGAKVIIHKEEATFLERGEMTKLNGTNFFTRAVVSLLAGWLIPKLGSEPCPYDLLAGEEYSLSLFGFDAYILHTPGHSPGSVSVVVGGEIVLAGDALFGVFRGSVFPPYALDAGQMVKSWGKLLKTGCSLFLPSHGAAVSREQLQKEFAKKSKLLSK